MEPCAALLSALMECAILLQNTLMLCFGFFVCFFFYFTVILLLHVTAVRPVVELIIRGALYSCSVSII